MRKQNFIIGISSGIIGALVSLSLFLIVNNNISQSNQLQLSKENSNDTNIEKVSQDITTKLTPPNFVDAAKKSIDAVVHVKTAYIRKMNSINPFLDYFFGNGVPQQTQAVQASGSGVIISSDGFIVTNNHVIENAQKIIVVLNDKREFTAKLVGTDPGTDIALLKIDEKNLPFIKVGNSDSVQVGEWVLAIGNPFNLTSTVTAGIVSAKARNINLLRKSYGIESFIQTDAAVNPGNSGGALVNQKGELIGINTAIASQTGSYTGYSFAVPVNIAMKVVKDIIEFGQVQRAVLGIAIHDINEDFAKKNDIKTLQGVYIESVEPNGAANKAKLKPKDIITKLGSISISNVAQLQEQLSKFRPGDEVTLTIRRGDKKISKTVTLENRMGDTQIVKGTDKISKLGAVFEKVTSKEKDMLHISNGVKVADIKSGKFLSAGIQKGFIILSMNGMKIDSINDIKNVINKSKGGIMVEGIYPNGMRAYYAFGN